MSFTKIIIVLALISVVSCRLSWYYADQAKNYHPPYDKGVNTNSYNGSNPDVCVNQFSCPAGYQVAVNNSYTPTITPTCPVPGWVSSTSALTQFNGCCLRYYSCLQVCGVNKAFCDGQFYGCAYTSCDPERNLRPGDRVYCRQLSGCMASYLSRGSSCAAFNTIQRSACTCTVSPFGTPSTFAGASQSPFFFNSNAPNPGQSPVGQVKRQVTTASASNIPSTTPTAGFQQASESAAQQQASESAAPSNSESANQQGSSTPTSVAGLSVSVIPRYSGLDYYNNLYAANFGQYFVRPIPIWELYQNRCPPNFENYVAVFTDQEQDDVNYFGQAASASTLSSWTKLF